MSRATPSRIRLARFIAVGADVLEWVMFPVFVEGFISPLEDALDLIVCVMLTFLVGWHYSFLPSFVVKVVPGVTLVPTWTIAMYLATHQKQEVQAPPTVVYAEPPSAAPPQLKPPPIQPR